MWTIFIENKCALKPNESTVLLKNNIRIKIDKEYKLVSKKEEKKPWDNNWAKYSVHSPQSY